MNKEEELRFFNAGELRDTERVCFAENVMKASQS